MNSNNQSFFIEEISQYDIIDESYSIMYKDMRNWHNLQLAIYECVLNEGNIINFIKDIIHKIIETLKKWWKNITDFIKKVINNIKSKLSNRDNDIKNIDPKHLENLTINSRELRLIILHGRDFISDINVTDDDLDEELDDILDSITIKLDTNNTEKMKEQLEKELSNINDIKKMIEDSSGPDGKIEEFFKDHDIGPTDDGSIKKLFAHVPGVPVIPFSRIYQDIKKTIENGIKSLEDTKKRIEKVVLEITKRLNASEMILTQMLKNNNDPDIDKLSREYMNSISFILQEITVSTLSVGISVYSKIFTKASNDLEIVVDSLIKKSKEDK